MFDWVGEQKTGLAKAAAFFATALMISVGLCGVNIFAATNFRSVADGASAWAKFVTGFFIATSYVEAFGILCSVVGLLVVGIVGVWRAFADAVRGRRDDGGNS